MMLQQQQQGKQPSPDSSQFTLQPASSAGSTLWFWLCSHFHSPPHLRTHFCSPSVPSERGNALAHLQPSRTLPTCSTTTTQTLPGGATASEENQNIPATSAAASGLLGSTPADSGQPRRTRSGHFHACCCLSNRLLECVCCALALAPRGPAELGRSVQRRTSPDPDPDPDPPAATVLHAEVGKRRHCMFN